MHFTVLGHPHISATHKNTFEFTTDNHLTPAGDCIIGILANFDPAQLIQLARKNAPIIITLRLDNLVETISAQTNPLFTDLHEVVIRLGSYPSSRTFAICATKAAKHLSRELVAQLKLGKQMEVSIETIKQE